MKLHSPEFQTSLQSFAAQRDAQAEQLALAAETMHSSAVQDAAMALNQMANDYTTVGERFSTQLDPAVRNLKYAVQDTSRNIERMREQIAQDFATTLSAIDMSPAVSDLLKALEKIEDTAENKTEQGDEEGEDDDFSTPPVYDDDLYFAPAPSYSDVATGSVSGTPSSSSGSMSGSATRKCTGTGFEREISTVSAQVRGYAAGISLARVVDSVRVHVTEDDIDNLATLLTMVLMVNGHGGLAIAIQFKYTFIQFLYGYYKAA